MSPISALAVEVPEAEPLVAPLRERHDPTACLGVPAHITVLVPFMAPRLLTEVVEHQIERLIATQAEFSFELTRVGRFPGVAYLAPDPAQPFIELTRSVVRAFPGYPPYAGQFSCIVPHLTVAHGDDAVAAEVAHELEKRLGVQGPVRSRCRSVVLLENSTGLWRQVRRFDLSRSTSR